jgi:hypothetical protein
MGRALSKSEFMALVINDYYEKRYAKRQQEKAASGVLIERMVSERNKRNRKRGF